MRTTLILLTILFILPSFARADLRSGLVGYWPIDTRDNIWISDTVGSTTDRSGNNFTGGFVSVNRSSFVGLGRMGQAGIFDGTNDAINVPDNASLRPGTSAWTYSAWIKTANTNIKAGIVVKSQTNSPFNQMSLVIADCTTSQNAAKRIQGVIVGTNSGTDVWWYCTSTDVIDGNWHLITFVRPSSGDALIYVDGNSRSLTLIRDSNTEPQNINNTESIRIASSTSAAQYFPGTMDDVRVYNRALSAEEVKQLYRQSIGNHYGSWIESIISNIKLF